MNNSYSSKQQIDEEDDFTSDFKANIQKIKEKKLKLVQISSFLSQSSQPAKLNTSDIKPNTSKYFGQANTSEKTATEKSGTKPKDSSSFEYKPTKKFSRTESCQELSERVEAKQAKISAKTTAKNQEELESEKEDVKSKVNDSLLKDAVPNCPICSKVFHTFNQRQTHLKKCAQVFRIKTENLVELIKKQQERIERDLSKGLVPTEVFIPQLKKKLGLPRNKSKKLDDTQVQLTSLGILASGSKLPTNKKKSKQEAEPSRLVSLDENAKSERLKARFELILRQKIVYKKKPDEESHKSSLVRTRFSNKNNYLWDKCKYFLESKENFYVEQFVNSGQFYVTNRVFIDRVDERRFIDVQVINTQTAFLLADLNDTTQRENMSIYYTQQMSRLNASQMNNASGFFFDSVHEDDYYNQNASMKPSELPSVDENDELEETNSVVENTSEMKDESSPPRNQAPKARDLFEETAVDEPPESKNLKDSSMHNTSDNLDEKLDNEIESNQQAAILIDETVMDDDEPNHNRTKSKVQSPQENIKIDDESNSVKSDATAANVCDETLDMAVLDEDEIESSQPQQTQVEKTPQIISKKRKSIDIIELSDDDDDDDDLIASKQLDLIVEEERPKKLKSDDVIELDSPVLVNSDRVGRFLNSQEEKKVASDDEEHLNEEKLLSLLNKTTPNVNVHKSLVRSPFASQCLDDVWQNFGEDNNVQEIYQFGSNNDPFTQTSLGSARTQKERENNCVSDESLANLSSESIREEKAGEKEKPAVGEDANEDDDFDVDEFIRNYRDKMAEKAQPKTIATTSKSPEVVFEKPNSPDISPEISPQVIKSFSKVISNEQTKKSSKTNAPAPEDELETPLNNRVLTMIRQQENQANITPMPNYQAMDTPNLKIELKRFGIKALPKRQAILKLTEIYEYTHRHKLASMPRSHSFNNLNDLAITNPKDITAEKSTGSKEKNVKDKTVEKASEIKKMMTKTVSDLNLNTKLIGKNQCRGVEISGGEESSNPSKLLRVNQKKPPRAPTSKQPKKPAKQRVQECTLDEQLIEMIEREEENDDEETTSSPEKGLLMTASQRARKQSKILDEAETKKFIAEFIQNEPNYYLNVLSYEPVEYDKFFAEVQAALNPRRVNNKVLMRCLDEYCVTFTLKALNVKSFGSQRAKTNKFSRK